MRDDAWHEDEYDRDDMPVLLPAERLDARYGRPDPRRNEWTGLDLAIGWGFAMLVVPVVGMLHGIAAALLPGGSDPGMSVALAIFAIFYAAPVITCYGVPAAALAAWVLRPVRHEWVHVAAFAALGALGCWLFALVMTGFGTGVGDGGWFTMTVAYGVASSVAGRVLAKRCAIARAERPRLEAGQAAE